jgi:hypothetical protein
MKPIKTKKQTKYALELILSEADKHLTEILSSVNNSSNRSFYLFGLYLSLIAFSFSRIINQEYQYFILLIGSVISCFILKNNLFPLSKEIKGSQPSNILIPYFDDFKDEKLDKEYLSVLIESYDSSIELNKNLIQKMVKNYSNSFKFLILSVLIFSIVFLFIFFQCN